jgi:hypothetical protein
VPDLRHRETCPACGDVVLLEHCNPCHRLFGHCVGCEAEYPDLRGLAAIPGRQLPPVEHPTCPHCEGTNVRPATRSDLENRGWLHLLG